jgi:hypothetical protein
MRDLTLKEDSEIVIHSYTDVAADWQNHYLNIGEAINILIPEETNNLFLPNLKLNRDELV